MCCDSSMKLKIRRSDFKVSYCATSLKTCSSTYIGTSVATPRAMASLGLESISMSLPSCLIINFA